MTGRDGSGYRRHNGEKMTIDALRQYISDAPSGMYSLGGQPDRAIIQQRVRLHPAFAAISYKGIPDVRVVVYRNEAAMAQSPCQRRNRGGKAESHQGGIGAGVDLETGVTHHAVHRDRLITIHPDTKNALIGMVVPYWPEVVEMSRRVAKATQLGYVGVDIVVDAEGRAYAAGRQCTSWFGHPDRQRSRSRAAVGGYLTAELDRPKAALSLPLQLRQQFSRSAKSGCMRRRFDLGPRLPVSSAPGGREPGCNGPRPVAPVSGLTQIFQPPGPLRFSW